MSQANITDVAKAANVSVATVSRALNEPEKVSTETQNRIKEAIKELNYRPNRLGVRLRKQKTNVSKVWGTTWNISGSKAMPCRSSVSR